MKKDSVRGRLVQSCAAKKMQEKDETNAPCEREPTNWFNQD